MKCPYKNFDECLYKECPAYIPENKSNSILLYQKESCRFVHNNVSPKPFNNCEQSYLESAT